MPNKLQPQIPAVPMNLFPTMDSLNEAIALAESKLPITDYNSLYAVLMVYHNTLIKQLGANK